MTTTRPSSLDDQQTETSSDTRVALQCAQCQKAAVFICSSCGMDGPRYCSTECQTDHWQQGHHIDCKATAARQSRQLLDNEAQGVAHDDIPLNQLSGTTATAADDMDDERADDLKFYMNQIYLIIKPVVICILLSIFWVKIGFTDGSDYSPTRPTYSVIYSNNSGEQQSTFNGLSSFASAAIIIGQIIVVTVVIVFFFRRGWIKVLIGFFMLVVVCLLGFMTYLLLLNMIQVFFIPLDYITLSVVLWNFVLVGLISIFWKGPLWLQQAYLTVLSSLMAFSLTGLEQWTTWILLGLLAVWDLIAVLCPFGPLRLLIESSRNQHQEVPALLYSVNAVWFMLAAPHHLAPSISSLAAPSDAPTTPTSTTPLHRRLSDDASRRERDNDDDDASETRTRDDADNGNTRRRASTESSRPPRRTTESTRQGHASTDEPRDEEDAERSGLKLGLGDFVFYSVLVARAAMYDWITTVCCTIAVLTGLTATIFLLAIYKKALPALPISIAFGILFYFTAKAVLVPYVTVVCAVGMIGL
ncbi:Presenilin-domain-containing protein [Gongronella butleri]|nr:Presenilin-domain-containing protein [Gongronella butleri]